LRWSPCAARYYINHRFRTLVTRKRPPFVGYTRPI